MGARHKSGRIKQRLAQQLPSTPARVWAEPHNLGVAAAKLDVNPGELDALVRLEEIKVLLRQL